VRRILTLLTAITLATTLPGCDSSRTTAGDDGNRPQVATLNSSGATPSADPEAKRPRYRLDMTAEDEEALMAPYFACLKEHGHTFVDAKKAGLGGAPPVEGIDARKVKEMQACEKQFYPLPAWELDPANPAAADFAHAVDECLRKKGVDLDDDSTDNVAKVLDAQSECERTVATAQK
jgi:hypothetical protein